MKKTKVFKCSSCGKLYSLHPGRCHRCDENVFLIVKEPENEALFCFKLF